MFDITKVNWKKVGIFASGVLFGTAGIKALSSKDAKNVYTNCTAAVLRAKDCVMKTATNIQENAEDIYAEAKNINEERAAEMEEFSDADTAAEAEEAENTEKELYGDEKLLETLSDNTTSDVRTTVNGIVDSIAEHVKEAEASDDLTILLIQYEPGTTNN